MIVRTLFSGGIRKPEDRCYVNVYRRYDVKIYVIHSDPAEVSFFEKRLGPIIYRLDVQPEATQARTQVLESSDSA